MTIHKSFFEALKEIGNATKDSKNPHFKSNYASLESVVDQIKPALDKNGLFYTQTMDVRDHAENILHLTVFSKDGGHLDLGKMCLPVANKENPQALKSSITLLRRAQLLAAFGMAEVDDDGNQASQGDFKPIGNQVYHTPKEFKSLIKDFSDGIKPVNHAPQGTKRLSEAQVKRAYVIAKTIGLKSMEVDIVCQKLYGNVIENLNKEQYDELCNDKLKYEGTVQLLQESIPF